MKNYVLILEHDYPEPKIVTRYTAEAPKMWQGLWGTGHIVEVPAHMDANCVKPLFVPEVPSVDAHWTDGVQQLAEQPLIADPMWVVPEHPMILDPAWEAPEHPMILDPEWVEVEGEEPLMILDPAWTIPEATMVQDPAWEAPQAPLIADPAFTFVPAVEAIPAHYTVEEDAFLLAEKAARVAREAQEAINREARAFLAATDWMIIRAVERGEEVSAELKDERQAARDAVVELE